MIKFNISSAENQYLQIADLCIPELKNKTFKIEDFLNGINNLIEELEIPKRLKEVGVSHNDIPKLSEDAMKQTRLLINNPVKIEYKDAVKIYESTL